MNLSRVATTLTVVGSLAAGGALTACGDQYGDETVAVEEYEDCDANDKLKREDDCGYWQKGSEYRVGGQPDSTWIFIYYSWVLQGLIRPPANWIPPHGLKTPSRIVQVPKRKLCAMGVLIAPAPPKPPAPAPRVNNPAPAKPPANAPKNNNPPKQQAPIKPGQRPAGC